MKHHFFKYSGAGNDFILFNDPNAILPVENKVWIEKICDRHFGIGADGVIYIRSHKETDFEMIYFNADGKIGSMCGNGARCAVMVASESGIITNKSRFTASDGIHAAELIGSSRVKVSMQNVRQFESDGSGYILNTGSPHFVKLVEDLDSIDIINEGRRIRYSDKYKPEGINVNFIEIRNNKIRMRTYERGVENETLACGTGTVAVALVYAVLEKLQKGEHTVETKAVGGDLSVQFNYKDENIFEDIWLEGPAEKTFEGEINL